MGVMKMRGLHCEQFAAYIRPTHGKFHTNVVGVGSGTMATLPVMFDERSWIVRPGGDSIAVMVGATWRFVPIFGRDYNCGSTLETCKDDSVATVSGAASISAASGPRAYFSNRSHNSIRLADFIPCSHASLTRESLIDE